MREGRRKKSSRGVSLIELMIALAIGALLVLGLVEVFAASRTAYQLSEGVARVQENGRFAIDYLQRDLRMVGHMGCTNEQARFWESTNNPILGRYPLISTFLTKAQQETKNAAGQPAPNYGAATDYLQFDKAIQGYEANGTAPAATLTLPATPVVATAASDWTPAIPNALFTQLTGGTGGKLIAHGDVLVLHYFAPTGAQLTSFSPPPNPDAAGASTIIKVVPSQWARLTEGMDNPGLFGISDCKSAAVFRASAVDGSSTITVTNDGALNKSALAPIEPFRAGQSYVYRAETIVYYVGLNGDGLPALYRFRYNITPAGAVVPVKEELVAGIESMQLRYGQDSQTDATKAPTGNMGSSAVASAVQPVADLATAWRRVGIVQIGLVATSPNPAAARRREDDTPTPMSALGVKIVAPDDGNYRSVYEESIALRNRLFGG